MAKENIEEKISNCNLSPLEKLAVLYAVELAREYANTNPELMINRIGTVPWNILGIKTNTLTF